jgi:uncharacterized protein (TIGR01244 family)
MNVRQLGADLAVAAQLSLSDVETAASMGFKTIINNRPDGEDPNQPAHADIEAKAKALGLTIHHLPLASGQAPHEALLRQTKAVIEAAEKPVLAFCRSGTRSTNIYYGVCSLED